MEKFIGTGVALVTPFTDELEVDHQALKRLVAFQIDNGIDYLVVLGTTGEYATLSEQEQKEVIATVVEENQERIPLVLGLGGNCTKKVVDQLRTADLSSFDAVLSVSPYYNKPSQEGIYQHYKAVAAAASKPVIMYNVPGRTGSNMLPTTVKRLAEEENIIGIKEAAGDLVQAMNLINMVPKGFLVISGEDMLTLPMILAGGQGVISVIGQGYPGEFSEMVRLGLERNVDQAYKLHYEVAPCIDLIFSEGNPAGIKALLAKHGICKNNLRLPLTRASEELTGRINSFALNF